MSGQVQWLTGNPALVPIDAVGRIRRRLAAGLAPWRRRQTAYMMHATTHRQKTVHGYCGFRAPVHALMFQNLREFPTDEGLRRLTLLGAGSVYSVHPPAPQ